MWGTHLEYASAIGSSPGIKQVVLASADKPLAAVGKLEWEDTALMEVELVLVRLGVVEHLHITALHAAQHTQTSTLNNTQNMCTAKSTAKVLTFQLSAKSIKCANNRSKCDTSHTVKQDMFTAIKAGKFNIQYVKKLLFRFSWPSLVFYIKI